GDLSRDGQRIARRDWPAAQPIGQRLAVDELQHECWRAARILETIDGADTRMVERGEHARFALEPRKALGVCRKPRRQDLDGNIAPELGVVCLIHVTHAASSEQREEAVAAKLSAGQIACDEIAEVCRGRVADEVHEAAGGHRLIQQRLHLALQRSVAPASVGEELSPIRLWARTGGVIKPLNAVPPFGCHDGASRAEGLESNHRQVPNTARRARVSALIAADYMTSCGLSGRKEAAPSAVERFGAISALPSRSSDYLTRVS